MAKLCVRAVQNTQAHRPCSPCLAWQGIIAVEGLVLDKVQPGLYTMHALPLKVAGADGAPARVILTQ